ncbi:unnamed protein product [Cercopithifilaria johnstoni]|uniref:Nucleolar protein 16 n=1 Tax=Cercopithifilaria johnstoni TaxID=2874296 RepID=A0A8J2MCL9_9BILA|nr:unnamed protein product [Cercopithifilaria johnstoni]
MIGSIKVGTAHEFLEGKIANENGQNEVHASAGKIEEISKEQKKKKRSRRSDPDSLLSEHDFVEGNDHGMGYEEAKADFTEIMGRRQKKKGRHRDEQQSKSEQFTGKNGQKDEANMGREHFIGRNSHLNNIDLIGYLRKPDENVPGIAFELHLEGNFMDWVRYMLEIESQVKKELKKQLLLFLLQSITATSLIGPKDLYYSTNNQTKKQEEDILEQIEKQEEDISGKKENKGLNEAMAYLVKDQSSTLESTGFKTEKITDHMTFGSDNIPKDSEILSKTEIITEASIPKGLEINVERLAEEHPEPLGATNLNFGGNVTGNITTTSAKEAKYDVGAEKKEPVVLVSQTDKVSHIMPTHERMCKLLPRDIQFCVHMIEKHGEDYETMAKDHGNVFRDSAKGIARKIRIFKESPQYETYLKQKAEKNGSVA